MDKIKFIIAADKGEFIPQTFFWRLETRYAPKVGDFAIVENRDSFTMVEILGIGETTKEKQSELIGGKGEIHKKVKLIVPREMLEKEISHG